MIPGILHLNSKVRYGMTSRNTPIYLFHPLDRKYSPCIVGCSQHDVSRNVLALVNVDHWDTTTLSRGNLVRILGPCGNQKAEEDALLFQYKGPVWKSPVVYTPTFEGYEPIQGVTFNVDPEGCIDIDDVVTIGDDGYIYITIADVASWMVVNPSIFDVASRIGQTMYNQGRVVAPMLPFQDQCSLIPGETRHGLALRCTPDLSNISFRKVQLVNNTSYTYETIYDSEYSVLLKSLASRIAGREITDSHEWIEQLMIFYNCEAAKKLIEKRQGLLRSQDAPDLEKLETYRQFGADLEFLANKSAHYVDASDPQRHWGLGRDSYCHATSPIRRFADVVNQMVLSGYSVFPYDLDTLNERAQKAKKYERDMFFLHQVLNSPNREIAGIVLNDHRIWVPDWRRIVTCRNSSNPGTRGTLKYSVDMNQTTWKKRMVFRFEDTNCPEPQSLE